jgi:hypothetical protein
MGISKLNPFHRDRYAFATGLSQSQCADRIASVVYGSHPTGGQFTGATLARGRFRVRFVRRVGLYHPSATGRVTDTGQGTRVDLLLGPDRTAVALWLGFPFTPFLLARSVAVGGLILCCYGFLLVVLFSWLWRARARTQYALLLETIATRLEAKPLRLPDSGTSYRGAAVRLLDERQPLSEEDSDSDNHTQEPRQNSNESCVGR